MSKKYKNGEVRLSRLGNFLIGTAFGTILAVIPVCVFHPLTFEVRIALLNLSISMLSTCVNMVGFEDFKRKHSWKYWTLVTFISPISLLYACYILIKFTWKNLELGEILFETVGEKQKNEEPNEYTKIKEVVEEAVNHMYYRHDAMQILKTLSQEEIDSAVDLAFESLEGKTNERLY